MLRPVTEAWSGLTEDKKFGRGVNKLAEKLQIKGTNITFIFYIVMYVIPAFLASIFEEYSIFNLTLTMAFSNTADYHS